MAPSILLRPCQQPQSTLLSSTMMTEARLPNEMQNGGSDLTHLNGFLALSDREMILVSWPESSMVIAFLLEILTTGNSSTGNSSNTLQSDTEKFSHRIPRRVCSSNRKGEINNQTLFYSLCTHLFMFLMHFV